MEAMSQSKNSRENISEVQRTDLVHLLASAVIRQRRSRLTEGKRNSAQQPADGLELIEATRLSVSGVHAQKK
jgi:hypothetical protein